MHNGAAVNIASIHYAEQTPSANNLCVMISQHVRSGFIHSNIYICTKHAVCCCVSHPTCAWSPLHWWGAWRFSMCFACLSILSFSRGRLCRISHAVWCRQQHKYTGARAKRGELSLSWINVLGSMDTKNSLLLSKRATESVQHTAARHYYALGCSLSLALSFLWFWYSSYIFCCSSGKRFSPSWSLVWAISAKQIFLTFDEHTRVPHNRIAKIQIHIHTHTQSEWGWSLRPVLVSEYFVRRSK